MDIKTYEQLTGKTIPDNQIAYTTAQIKRVQTKLENLLGYTLAPENLYTEKGKTQADCSIDTKDVGALEAPDPVKGIYKVFPCNWKDTYLLTDPFFHVYQAKLVKVIDNYQFITYETFDNVNQNMERGGIGLSIERCATCGCQISCNGCLQLAVDADWVDFSDEGRSVPNDLLYLLCDMIDYYTDASRNIQSESVTGHSWSKSNRYIPPEEEEDAKILLRRYAGPYGQIKRIPVL